jgi:hypothetical protein
MVPDFLHLSLSLSYVYNGCEIFHHFGHKFGQKRKRGWYIAQGAYKRKKTTDMSSLKTLVRETAGRWGVEANVLFLQFVSFPYFFCEMAALRLAAADTVISVLI